MRVHGWGMDSAVAVLVVCFVVGLVAGVLIGRWWALLLAVLVPVAFIPAGDDSDGAPAWQTALVLFAPVALLGLAVGVGARHAAVSGVLRRRD